MLVITLTTANLCTFVVHAIHHFWIHSVFLFFFFLFTEKAKFIALLSCFYFFQQENVAPLSSQSLLSRDMPLLSKKTLFKGAQLWLSGLSAHS